ncbi:hypothetical protein B0H16DRAFT_1878687 [Mycena metata]|uniref:Uncharacterized protein n=1 Tax=Mycena metata TaxID=1033252 RepID=A0AAD7K879_9AGAR|nr:hypothetical protein B0H16DRAFT_1878687 [Mycena metata]
MHGNTSLRVSTNDKTQDAPPSFRKKLKKDLPSLIERRARRNSDKTAAHAVSTCHSRRLHSPPAPRSIRTTVLCSLPPPRQKQRPDPTTRRTDETASTSSSPNAKTATSSRAQEEQTTSPKNTKNTPHSQTWHSP